MPIYKPDRREITLMYHGRDGVTPKLVKIRVPCYGPHLAVHRKLTKLDPPTEGKDPASYAVTHLPSGYRMNGGLRRKDAIEIAHRLNNSELDLDFPMDEFHAWPTAKKRRLAELVGRQYGPKEEHTIPSDIPPKLKTLLEIEGLGYEQMLKEAIIDSVVPGICMNEGCDYTTGTEPDATRNWCEACDTNSVSSCLILAGMI